MTPGEISGTLMTHGEYAQIKGDPAPENPGQLGFLVERDGPKNHADYEGHISWSSEQEFRHEMFGATEETTL